MEIFYGIGERVSNRPMGIGLGTFDGIHMGHAALMKTLIDRCQEIGLGAGIYTFTSHPENVLRKRIVTHKLCSLAQKKALLCAMGMDCLFLDDFNLQYAKMKPEDFVKDILVSGLNMKLAVVGFNYTFGNRGLGNVRLLRELGHNYGFDIVEIAPVKVGGEVVSSTLIRHYIGKGDIEKANRLLGKHYAIGGTVEHGKHLGNTLGFPTANITPEDGMMLPPNGVYATRTKIGSVIYDSISNVGVNPTFDNLHKSRIETFIFDFNTTIYGDEIEILFLGKVRDEKRFTSKEELVNQIQNDIIKTKAILLSHTASVG